MTVHTESGTLYEISGNSITCPGGTFRLGDVGSVPADRVDEARQLSRIKESDEFPNFVRNNPDITVGIHLVFTAYNGRGSVYASITSRIVGIE